MHTFGSHDRADDPLAQVAWSAGTALLCWLAALHLGVVASFAVGAHVSAGLAPLVTAGALAFAWALAGRRGLMLEHQIAATVVTALVIGGGLLIASAFYDLTWDGQWYHQTAVYKMAQGWNPVRDPVQPFGHTWQLWVLHYAKGPWYVALAIYAGGSSIEAAKVASVIAPAIAFLVVGAVARELGLSRTTSTLVALVVALNPVATCGLVTHQVDGMLVSFLACAVAAGISDLRRPDGWQALAMAAASVLCMNTKFTGFVYLCFFFLAGGVYCLVRDRALTARYVVLVGITTAVGVGVFGFNPYVTNFVHRGHPFYPVQGSAEYPGLAAQGKDPIELYETPANMVGRSRFVRLAYGVFGRPGTAPYVTKDAEFAWPFTTTRRDFALYYFHDVRIGGFGPWFSGLLVIAVVIGMVSLPRRALPFEAVLLVATIVASLLVSTHTWWARYGPHLWWVPTVIAAAVILRGTASRIVHLAAHLVVILLLVDTLLLSAVHAQWEWRSTRALRGQLTDLKRAGSFTVDLAYFDVPVAERFATEGITFTTMPKYACAAEHELTLMSVCRGYPEWIRVCLADEARASTLRQQPHWQWSAQP